MNYPSVDSAVAGPPRWLRWSFGASLFMAILTGFGQMPIFKRYYIADIPGLGWLAQFYVTHVMHYFFGMLLLGFAGYFVTGWLLGTVAKQRLTILKRGRGIVLGGILLTGILLALKNFPGYFYPPAVIVALDLIHLGLVMLWLVLGVVSIGFAR
jgi:hypothetical protein